MGAAGMGLTQKENGEGSIDQQHVFHRMALFLAAITARLLKRVLGARDAPFGAIMAKRGEAGVGSGSSAGVVGTPSAHTGKPGDRG